MSALPTKIPSMQFSLWGHTEQMMKGPCIIPEQMKNAGHWNIYYFL